MIALECVVIAVEWIPQAQLAEFLVLPTAGQVLTSKGSTVLAVWKGEHCVAGPGEEGLCPGYLEFSRLP